MTTIKEEARGHIRIIKTPDGFAPSFIRSSWLNVILPVIATGLEDDVPVYVVRQSVALKLLKCGSKGAFRWFENHGFPQSHDACFNFKQDDCKVEGPPLELAKVKQTVEQFLGLLEVGVGAHDHPANQQVQPRS